jgi:hypothetical protein
MAIESARTAYGYVVTCTSGTATSTLITDTPVHLAGICVAGAATTDIITVTDKNGKFVYQGCALVGQSASLSLGGTVRVEGLMVGMAGATTGKCSIFLT